LNDNPDWTKHVIKKEKRWIIKSFVLWTGTCAGSWGVAITDSILFKARLRSSQKKLMFKDIYKSWHLTLHYIQFGVAARLEKKKLVEVIR